MRPGAEHYGMLVIGSGPAGQKAAIQAAKAGCRVALIERDHRVGGACVYRGTIPSKTLRETALELLRARRYGGAFSVTMEHCPLVERLMPRLRSVLDSHDRFIGEQLERNGIDRIHGQASFVDRQTLNVTGVDGSTRKLAGDNIVIATGSRPREPDDIDVDHEFVLDSDSVLSMCYLPRSLLVLGSGVIACEYASIFAILGVEVTMIDRYARPLGFLDPDLSDHFTAALTSFGARFQGGRSVTEMTFEAARGVSAVLDDGSCRRAEKVLFALGRVANLDGLEIERAGLVVNGRGLLDVDRNCRTAVPHIYAAGDVIGAPSLASSAMEQGRLVVRHALGLSHGAPPHTIPAGIYTIPEISSVGLGEAQARAEHGAVKVAVARVAEVARGQIDGNTDGMLKLIADADGRRLLGVQIVGEGATELIHLGQMALVQQLDIDVFVENIFNFPTLAESYRIAALAVIAQRAARPAAVA